MKTPAVVAFALLVASPCLSDHAYCDELAERAAITKEAHTSLRSEQFSRLEDLASRYRTTKSRTSSGIWHLSVLHAGIASAFFGGNRDDGEFWANAERVLKDWIAQYPDSPTPRLAYSSMLEARGWSFRGNGYAHTVNPQDWEPFHQHIEQSRLNLEKYKNIASVDPRWYESMEEIAKIQGWPEADFNQLFAEGLQREPTFYPTYFAAMAYYSPKWRGSASAIERFAKEALERTQSTEGYGMYARIYWYAAQVQYGDRLFSDSLVDWPVMKKGIDDVLKTYPDDWNVNNFARFACLSADKEKTAELIGRIKSTPITQVWSKSPTFQQCKSWATS